MGPFYKLCLGHHAYNLRSKEHVNKQLQDACQTQSNDTKCPFPQGLGQVCQNMVQPTCKKRASAQDESKESCCSCSQTYETTKTSSKMPYLEGEGETTRWTRSFFRGTQN